MNKPQKTNAVGRPRTDLDKAFTKIRRFLKIGDSLHKACLLGCVPYSTLKPHYDKDEDFRNKIERTRNIVNIKAKENLVKAVMKGDIAVSQDWLEVHEKDEWSKRQEIKDVTEIDEGVTLLREIILKRRVNNNEH